MAGSNTVGTNWCRRQTSQRAYVLLKEKIQLNVNAMLRLPDPIQFEPVKARKQPTEPSRNSNRLRELAQSAPPPPAKPEREKHNYLGEPKHNVILASLAQVRL